MGIGTTAYPFILEKRKVKNMNETVEAVRHGEKIADERFFDVVNDYDITTLSIRTSDKRIIMAMQINKCERVKGGYEFSQSCTWTDAAMYQLQTQDIEGISAEYSEEANTFFVTCKLKNDLELWLMIINVENMESRLSDFREVDVYELNNFLEEVIQKQNEYYCISSRITDAFGFDVKMNPKRVFVNALDDEWKLHISDDFSSFEVPVVDDSVNEFYMRETDVSKQIIVKPFGQPFMEISMFFLKRHN